MWLRPGERVWRVPSESRTRCSYEVDVVDWTCTCKWFHLYAGKPCKHIEAVRDKMEADAGRLILEPPPAHKEAVEPRKRKRYPQNDKAYSEARRNEKRHMLPALYTLCDAEGLFVPAFRDADEVAKRGRPPILTADVVMANYLRFFRDDTSREMSSEYTDAFEKGYLSRDVHDNSVLSYLQDERLTPVLERLITASAKPLIPLEEFFAADATAFSGDRFARWYDVRQGRVTSQHKWVKLQLMCGVHTHVITAAFALHTDGPDGPHMAELVRRTAAGGFNLMEVSADKGYSSVEAHDIIAAFGAQPYIAFKRVATGWSGGKFGEMFNLFNTDPEGFLDHYHKRSNVETVFSMVERRFGKYLMSRRPISMQNEMLFKLLCHNIGVLIQEMYKHDVEIKFGGRLATTKNNEPPQIIRFPGA
jgi:hypothetical protein